jgi:hypothetical protein
MKQALPFLCLLLSGCGGAAGNIERYEYALSKPALDRYVEQVLRRSPDYPSREIEARYHVSANASPSGYRFLLLPYKGQRLVFGFETVSLGKRSMVVLVYAAPFGDELDLPIHRHFWEKWRYASLFESMFVDKLNQRLKAVKWGAVFHDDGKSRPYSVHMYSTTSLPPTLYLRRHEAPATSDLASYPCSGPNHYVASQSQ